MEKNLHELARRLFTVATEILEDATEVGVAVPADKRKLKMVLKDDAGLRSEERSVQIEPGQKLLVRW